MNKLLANAAVSNYNLQLEILNYAYLCNITKLKDLRFLYQFKSLCAL